MQTNYGEEYNRESMYETAREQLLDCKKIVINGKYYDSLIGVMIEDCGMEQEKHEEYLKLSETYQQENDDEKSFYYFSKAWEIGKVQDKLLERSQIAVDKAKEYLEFKEKVRKAYRVNENLKKLSVTQIKKHLTLLNEHKDRLLEHMYGDTVTNLTYSSYKTTQKLIKEVEDELSKRISDKVL